MAVRHRRRTPFGAIHVFTDAQLDAFLESQPSPLAGADDELHEPILAVLDLLRATCADAAFCRRLGPALARACEREAATLDAYQRWEAGHG
jgi:hypothetical protein